MWWKQRDERDREPGECRSPRWGSRVGGVVLVSLFCSSSTGAKGLHAEPEEEAAPQRSPEQSHFVVEICDTTRLRGTTLQQVQSDVEQIYRGGGIEIIWSGCGQDGFGRSYSSYEASVNIRWSLQRGLEENERDMGWVFGVTNGLPGPLIPVSRRSVEEFIGLERAMAPLVIARALARVIAHELAHRFLQRAAHTDKGILKAKVSPEELTTASPYGRYFTNEQIRFMSSLAATALDLNQGSFQLPFQ